MPHSAANPSGLSAPPPRLGRQRGPPSRVSDGSARVGSCLDPGAGLRVRTDFQSSKLSNVLELAAATTRGRKACPGAAVAATKARAPAAVIAASQVDAASLDRLVMFRGLSFALGTPRPSPRCASRVTRCAGLQRVDWWNQAYALIRPLRDHGVCGRAVVFEGEIRPNVLQWLMRRW